MEEYLTYDQGTDNRYELVNGELVMVPLPTADHADEIDLLLEIFRSEIRRQGLPWKASDQVGVYIGKSSLNDQDSHPNQRLVVTQELPPNCD